MSNFKNILENIFFSQDTTTVTLSFDNNIYKDKNIYQLMTRFKNSLNKIGIHTMSFSPDTLLVSIVTTKDKLELLQKIVDDYKLKIV
jgi:hypothetical protein